DAGYRLRSVPAVAIVILVLAGLAVFAIAAVTVGREAHRLDAVAPRATYVLDDAVEYVADHLPPESQARLTHDEVRRLLRMHMAQLREHGLQPAQAVDHVQDISEPVVVEETDAAGYLIGRVEATGLPIEDVDVVYVVDAHLAYFESIGAVGPPADDDE
ncbi:MAG TPA: hypothetical protein VKD67_03370, partial [Acidimicrobiales bacterium]|nr:hypothetical protein [Acidimicrobiales bacterium]